MFSTQRSNKLTTVQTREQRISRKPPRTCAIHSPNRKPVRRGIPSHSPYVLKKSAQRVKSRISKKQSGNSATGSPNIGARPIRKMMPSTQPSTLFVPILAHAQVYWPTLNTKPMVSTIHSSRYINASPSMLHGPIQGAAEYLLELMDTVNDDVRANKFIVDWLAGGFLRHVLA
ncbi:hypothetical protein HD554DRAFT_1527938 [Boletus coccyginus]|nr:hypothetical protein HD554DRAFT_1527938 [Boletus coccyginus]